jgi:PAS domain S-box-containing protein
VSLGYPNCEAPVRSVLLRCVASGMNSSDTVPAGCRKASPRRLALFGQACRLPFFLLLLAATAFAAAAPQPARNILVLYSFSDRGLFDAVANLESEIRSRISAPVNFDVEYLEAQRFEDPEYEKSLAATLGRARGGKRFDLVVVAVYQALRFAAQHREEIAPGAPIVFSYVSPARIQGQPLWPGVTGVTITIDVRGTLDLLLKLHPGTRNVAIIAGTSAFERFWLGEVRKEIRSRPGGLHPIELVGLPPEELPRRADSLPPHTVVVIQLVPADSAQLAFGVYDSIQALSQRIPTYCLFKNYCLDRGGVGGSYADHREQSAKTAELAARILAGEPPESIPVVHDSGARVQVDSRMLRRWGIPEAALPADAVVRNREPSFWQRRQEAIIGVLGLAALGGLLLAGAWWQRRGKKKVEASLRETEQRLAAVAAAVPALIWMADADAKVTYLGEKRVEFAGPEPGAGLGNTWATYIHPDDLPGVLSANARAFERQEPFSKEYRLRRRDGVYRWMLDVASPRFREDGSFAGMIGSAIDVTDQRSAEQALESVSGRLIEAQEKERSRIARELHDDIGQKLTLLSLEIDQMRRSAGGQPGPGTPTLAEIRQHCAAIAVDVQALSHELHSSKLDYLGIVAALRGLCDESAKKHGATIRFTHEDVPSLSREVSLGLFRIAQEALHNAAKYSGANEFAVDLRGTREGVQLEIVDSGAGFDFESVKEKGGLGLLSMQERASLLKGTFRCVARPEHGTRILVWLPVPAGPEVGVEEVRYANSEGA